MVPSHRFRMALVGSLAVLAVLVAGLLLAVHLLLQPQRFTALLETAASAANLKLKLEHPAHAELLPVPGLVLEGLSLSVPGHAEPMLTAARGKLRVPWRALLGGVPTITQLELDAPQMNLDELDGYIAGLPTGRAPWLPQIRTGVVLNDGSLSSHGRIVLADVTIKIGQLEPGRPFQMTVSARNASALPISLAVTGVPHSGTKVVSLEPMQLLGDLPGYGHFDLIGHARWLGGSRAQVAVAGSAGAPALSLNLAFSNTAGPAMLDVLIRRPHQQLDAHFDPAALLTWWKGLFSQGPGLQPLVPPPLAAAASASQFTFGTVQFSGLSVRINGKPAPAVSKMGQPSHSAGK